MTADRVPTRAEVPASDTWDLCSLYPNDAAWEAAFAEWEKMLDVFYGEIGYDRKTTKPKPETLRALGAEWLVPVLWGKK